MSTFSCLSKAACAAACRLRAVKYCSWAFIFPALAMSRYFSASASVVDALAFVLFSTAGACSYVRAIGPGLPLLLLGYLWPASPAQVS